MSLWDDEPFETTLAQVRKQARRDVRDGFTAAGFMPASYDKHPEDVYEERALVALDAIRLGTEGHLRLKSQVLSPFGVTTTVGKEPYLPSNAKIVRAAKRALKGEIWSGSW